MQQHLYVAEKLMELDRIPKHVALYALDRSRQRKARQPASIVGRGARRFGDAIARWPSLRVRKTMGDDCGC